VPVKCDETGGVFSSPQSAEGEIIIACLIRLAYRYFRQRKRQEESSMEGNINDKVAAATERAFALINAEGWKVEKEADGGVLSTKPVEGSSVNAVRAVGIIHGKKAQDLQERLWGFRKEDWKKWSDDIEEWKIVQEIDDTTRVIYQLNSLPWPLWSRDVVFVQKKFEKVCRKSRVFSSAQTLLTASLCRRANSICFSSLPSIPMRPEMIRSMCVPLSP